MAPFTQTTVQYHALCHHQAERSSQGSNGRAIVHEANKYYLTIVSEMEKCIFARQNAVLQICIFKSIEHLCVHLIHFILFISRFGLKNSDYHVTGSDKKHFCTCVG